MMKFSEIKNGKYTVSIKLEEDVSSKISKDFEEEPEFKDICSLNGNIFEYESEAILPYDSDNINGKDKILMVFGNPAINSVKHGMFYFSKKPKLNSSGDGYSFSKHQMWTKLEKADLIINVDDNSSDSLVARQKEAAVRRTLILDGKSSDNYLLGLTTFYSLPTPVIGKYKNVDGVKKVFGEELLLKIQAAEIKRISEYHFSKNATLIFVQKSTYEIFQAKAPNNIQSYYWPGVAMMKKGSSGDDLKKLLETIFNSKS